MKKLFQNEKFIAWAVTCIIYLWGAFICHNYFGIYVLGFLSGFLSIIANFSIRADLEKIKEVSTDICKTCADRGHCEWWCNGTAYTLSSRYSEDK